MTPYEIAMQFMSARNQCRGDRCIFRTKCGKGGESCPFKEIAMTLRAQEARIETLETQLASAEQINQAQADEIIKLRKVNKDYNKLVNAFRAGYRPPRVSKGGKPRRVVRRKKDPVEMDGDEHYGLPPREPDLPTNII